jgi:hypothetical protein
MSIFSMEDPINYDWLIENGFSQLTKDGNNPHILNKILRSRKPFVYININYVTLDATLHWLDIGTGTGITRSTQSLFLGKIDDRIRMNSIMHKYSQENCLT